MLSLSETDDIRRNIAPYIYATLKELTLELISGSLQLEYSNSKTSRSIFYSSMKTYINSNDNFCYLLGCYINNVQLRNMTDFSPLIRECSRLFPFLIISKLTLTFLNNVLKYLCHSFIDGSYILENRCTLKGVRCTTLMKIPYRLNTNFIFST
jgi:hypothetical protein